MRLVAISLFLISLADFEFYTQIVQEDSTKMHLQKYEYLLQIDGVRIFPLFFFNLVDLNDDVLNYN